MTKRTVQEIIKLGTHICDRGQEYYEFDFVDGETLIETALLHQIVVDKCKDLATFWQDRVDDLNSGNQNRIRTATHVIVNFKS